MGEEVVVVDIDVNAQYVFNETSRAAWLALGSGDGTMDSVLEAIRQQFSDVPDNATLQKDVSVFLDDLISKGLIQVESPN